MATPANMVDSVSMPARSAAKGAAGGGRKGSAAARARKKFEQWLQALVAVREQHHVPLVEPEGGDEEGVLSQEEFNLLPNLDFVRHYWIFEEAREALDAMEEELRRALEAREAAKKIA